MYKETIKMKDGDIVFEDGDFIIIDGREELRQNLENRYSINKEEWFLNIDLGLDYEMLQGKTSDGAIELAIRECGLQDERVMQVTDIIIARDRPRRHADITFKLVDMQEEEYQQEVVGLD